MKQALIILALLVMLPAALPAQQHPTDPNATYLGRFTVTVTIPCASKGGAGVLGSSNSTSASSSLVTADITVFAISGGQIDYIVDANSIRFSGDCSDCAALSTQQIFSLLSQAAVARGVALGYTACISNCNSPSLPIVRVFQALCVTRTGSGNGTTFTSCDAHTWCVKEYTVCCPNGQSTPVVTQIGGYNIGSCEPGVGCESTCQ